MAAAPKLTLGTNVDGHTYIGGDPSNKQSWLNMDEMANTQLTGQSFLDELSKRHPSVIPTIKALSEGRQALPTGRATTDPYWQSMLTMAHQYDPSLDQADYGKRFATAKAFAPGGASAANLTNLNQGLGHLYGLVQAIPKVAGHAGLLGLSHLLNMGQNYYEDVNGDPGITDYTVHRTALSSELASIFKGKGASAEAEVNKFYDMLGPNSSTAQKKMAAKGLTELLASRIDELGQQYTQGMGTVKQGIDLLNPNAKKQFTTIQALDESNNNAPVAPSTPTTVDDGLDPATRALLKKHNIPGY